MIVRKKRNKTEVYEFIKIVPYQTYDNLKKRAEELGQTPPKKCFKCGREFQGKDIAFLGVAKVGKNQFFCSECTHKAWEEEGM